MKTETKYLGMILSEKLGYKIYLEVTRNKAATVSALSRLMSNMDGPTKKKANSYEIVINQLLCAAPIWLTALERKNKKSFIEKPQRKIALRVVCSYRTVSTQAVLVSQLLKRSAHRSISLRAKTKPSQ